MSGPIHVQKNQPAAAAAAKSLQSCPTLCDPIDGSPPGSPVPGILQARVLEWVAIAFSRRTSLLTHKLVNTKHLLFSSDFYSGIMTTWYSSLSSTMSQAFCEGNVETNTSWAPTVCQEHDSVISSGPPKNEGSHSPHFSIVETKAQKERAMALKSPRVRFQTRHCWIPVIPKSPAGTLGSKDSRAWCLCSWWKSSYRASGCWSGRRVSACDGVCSTCHQHSAGAHPLAETTTGSEQRRTFSWVPRVIPNPLHSQLLTQPGLQSVVEKHVLWCDGSWHEWRQSRARERGRGGNFGAGWRLPARNLHSPSKPSMAGMGLRAQEARRKGKGRREDQTRLQDRIKQRQSPQIPPYEPRHIPTWHNMPQHDWTWLLDCPTYLAGVWVKRFLTIYMVVTGL